LLKNANISFCQIDNLDFLQNVQNIVGNMTGFGRFFDFLSFQSASKIKTNNSIL